MYFHAPTRPVFGTQYSPVLVDPSCTTSTDYGVVSDDYFGLSNTPTTFIIDREGVIRFEYRGKGSFDRPSVDLLLETIDGFKKK